MRAALNFIKTFTPLSIGLCLSANIGAQTANPISSVCGQILENGVRNNYYLYTETELYSLYKSRLCELKSETYQSFLSSASSLGLDIPVAEVIIGLDASSKEDSSVFKSKFSAFCASSYSQNEYKSKFQISQSQVSSSLANAWTACTNQFYSTWLDSNSRGVTVSGIPQDGYGEFTVFVKRKSPAAGAWKFTGISPSSVQCSYKGASIEVNKTTVKENDLQLNCTKNPNLQVEFSVATSMDGTSNAIRIPALPSRIAELIIRNNELSQSLQDSAKKIDDLNRRFIASQSKAAAPLAPDNRTDIRAVYNHQDTSEKICPDGYYLVGFNAVDRVVGAHAQGAIAGLLGICKKLAP